MEQNASANTFHLFPRLPTELRIQIWEAAIDVRVLTVCFNYVESVESDSESEAESTESFDSLQVSKFELHHYYTSTPVPAVTRVCQESRLHSSYRKAWMTESSPRYIQANFNYDIVQIRTYEIPDLAADSSLSESIRHLRVTIDDTPDKFGFPLENFGETHVSLPEFTNLKSCCILVDCIDWRSMVDLLCLDLSTWGNLTEENLRMVDAMTGEWIALESCDTYRDRLYAEMETARFYDSWREERHALTALTEEEKEAHMRKYEREAYMPFLRPLPRMEVDWLPGTVSRHW